MAVNDFTNKNIQDTYQRVVQTDGTNLADGTGSSLPISFDGNDVIIPGALKAQSYIVSESVISISSGSTIFGNSTDDTHAFIGNISASYTGSHSFGGVTIGGSGASGGSQVLTLLVRSPETTNNYIQFLGSSNRMIFVNAGATFLKSISGKTLFPTNPIEAASSISASSFIAQTHITASGNINASGDLIIGGKAKITGHITASGNISSSGNVIAQSGVSKGFFINNSNVLGADFSSPVDTHLHLGNNTTFSTFQYGRVDQQQHNFKGSITSSNGILATNAIIGNRVYPNGFSNSAPFIAGSTATGNDIGSSTGFFATTHITASRNISASGDLTANNITGVTSIESTLYTIDGQNAIDFASDTHLFGSTAKFSKLRTQQGLEITAPITASNDISASGNIIGVTGSFDYVKTDKLQVGATGGTDILSIDGGDLQLENNKQITFSDIGDGNTGRVRIVGNEDDDFIRMHVDNSNSHVLALNTTGIGIGTTSPGEKLEVVGNISSSGIISASKGHFVNGITLDSRLNANQIGSNGNVGNTEYGHLNGVTSAIQTQFNDITNATGSFAVTSSNVLFGNITSSGAISASGNITAPSYTGQIVALDRLNYYITIAGSEADKYHIGRNTGIESGDFNVLFDSPFSIDDEDVYFANILPVSMSTIGLRSGVRIAGGGTCELWITTGSRSDWATADSVPLGFGGSGSVTIGNGQDFATLDIPEFPIGAACDAVYLFVRTEDTDAPTVRVTGQLYGRT